MTGVSTELCRSASLPVVGRHLCASAIVDPSPVGAAVRSSSSTPTNRRTAEQAPGCRGNGSWKSRQAASIESCLRRQQKEKLRASQEKEKAKRVARAAKRVSLQGCSNPDIKAWALAHEDQFTNGYAHSLEVVKPRAETPVQLAQVPNYHRLCGFLPTDDQSINPLLSVLHLEPEDVFYDLGCGDGRVVVSVVKHFRCRGVGVEVNRKLILKARAQAEAEFSGDPKLLERISFVEDDISKVSLSNARAVFIYMPNSAVHTLVASVLPHCGLQDGTLIISKDAWLHEQEALRNCRYLHSKWSGGIHCYKWQKAETQPGDPAWV